MLIYVKLDLYYGYSIPSRVSCVQAMSRVRFKL